MNNIKKRSNIKRRKEPQIDMIDIENKIKDATQKNDSYLRKNDMIDVMKVINNHNKIIQTLQIEIKEKNLKETKNMKLLRDINLIKKNIKYNNKKKKVSKKENKSTNIKGNKDKKNKINNTESDSSSSSEESEIEITSEEDEEDEEELEYNI